MLAPQHVREVPSPLSANRGPNPSQESVGGAGPAFPCPLQPKEKLLSKLVPWAPATSHSQGHMLLGAGGALWLLKMSYCLEEKSVPQAAA